MAIERNREARKQAAPSVERHLRENGRMFNRPAQVRQ
jgi:hypothetical protein